MSRYDAYDNYKPPGIAISKSKMQVLKDSAILSLNEFNRIKQSSFFSPQPSTSKLSSVNSVGKYKINDSNTINQEQNPSIQKALLHKKKIVDYEKAIDRGNNPLFMEKMKIEDPYKVVGGKNNDVVKAFDHLCRKAKVATIWDRQMDERKMMEGMYTRKEKRLDEMMELERLKEIQYIEQRDKELKKSKLEGQRAIIDQIYDNDKERNKKREAIEREKILMFKQIEKLKEEEKQLARRKKLEAEARIRECVETQKIIALNKKKKMLEEKEEDLKIKKFNMEKMEREEKLIQEKKRLAIQKEKEIQALREKQEKQKDKLDEMNEIKAKKAAKEAEYKEKLKEKEEILKKERLEREMKECNDKMLEIRKKINESEIQKDKDMMEKIALDNKKVEEEEKIKKKIYIEKMLANKIEIEKQIVDNEEREKIKKLKEMEEEKKIKKEIDKYLLSLEEIRKQKIQELRDLKIKDAYILPLEKYNYSNIENKNK